MITLRAANDRMNAIDLNSRVVFLKSVMAILVRFSNIMKKFKTKIVAREFT